MVDARDVQRGNALLTEFDNIDRAIDNIEGGGRITSMVIGSPERPDAPLVAPAQVVTTYMRAPEAMYQAISGFLRERQNSILDELRDMGITGLNGR